MVQWLVKRSIESRAEKADRLNAFAVNQFHNDFDLPSTKEQSGQRQSMVTNLKCVQEQLKPKRKFRKTGNIHENDEKLQVETTLLEYASQLTPRQTLIEKFSIKDNVEFLDHLTEVDEVPTHFNEDNRQDVFSEYKSLKLEFGEDDESKKITRKINELKETKNNLERQLALLKQHLNHSVQKQRDEESKVEQLQNQKKHLQDNLHLMKEKHSTADAKVLERLTTLLQENEAAKQKETKFKSECKENLAAMQLKTKEYIEILEDANSVAENKTLLESEKQKLAKIRLKVSKKTRQVIVVNRALDVPSRSELAQYQRRFLELYTQVSAKHKETKQFYTLYNILNDTKQYIEKEKSLLNSIFENFSSSMSSPAVRDQFLKQFESIVMGIKENKNKVLKRQENEKQKKEKLCGTLVALLDLQRKYVLATKKLQQLAVG